MIKDKYVTKEYFYSDIKEIQSKMYIMLDTALTSQKSYHEKLMERQMGALHEGFSDEVRGAMDGITMLLEKSKNHEPQVQQVIATLDKISSV